MSLDVTQARLEKTLRHERALTTCRFSPCGKFLYAGTIDCKVLRWNLETDEKTVLEGHGSWITALAFLGDRLLSADLHGTVICRDAWKIPKAHAEWLRSLATDGTRVATGGQDRAARVWSAEGKLLREFPDHKGYVMSVAFHPDGRSLVTGDLFGAIRHWDLDSGKLVRELDAGILHSRGEEWLADVGGVRSLQFDAEGKTLAASGLREAKSNTFCPGLPTVLLFDWANGQSRRRVVKEEKTDGPVNRARFLSDGTLAAVGEGQSSGALWFWKGEAAEPLHSLSAPSLYDLDLHPDGERLAAASFESKGKGGNGRHADRSGYVPNEGSVRIFTLKPPPPRKK